MSDSTPSRTLLVPISLEAKVLRQPMQAPRLADGAAPFEEPTVTLPSGVHLHWAVPAALRTVRTVTLDGKELQLVPGVPTHWLVVRSGPTALSQRTLRAWLVDSRQRSATPVPAQTGALMVTPPPQGKVFTMFGEVDAAPAGAGLPGWGVVPADKADPVAASYYPLVMNCFGFHDDLADLQRQPPAPLPDDNQLSYTVVGWYAAAKLDPLSRTNRTKLLDEWNWQVPGGYGWDHLSSLLSAAQRQTATPLLNAGEVSIAVQLKPTNDLRWRRRPDDQQGSQTNPLDQLRDTPSQIVCHGSVFAVPARPRRPEDERSYAGAIEPTLSNSLERAVVDALGIADSEDAEDLKDIIQALLPGDEEVISTANGLADLASRLHERSFKGVAGRGPRYLSLAVTPRPPFPPVPPDTRRAITAKTKELARLVEAAGTADGPNATDPHRLRLSLKRPNLKEEEVLWFDLRQDEDMANLFNRYATLDSLKQALRSPQVHEDPGPRWYHPLAPHLMLKNVGRTQARRFGRGSTQDDGGLPCRRASQVIDVLEFGAQAQFGPARLTDVSGAQLLTNLGLLAREEFPVAACALVAEAALLDPENARLIDAAACKPAGMATSPERQERLRLSLYAGLLINALPARRAVTATADDLEALEQRLLHLLAPGQYMPSDIGLAVWLQPWIPILANVRVEHLPLPMQPFWTLDGVAVDTAASTRQRYEPQAADMGLNPVLPQVKSAARALPPATFTEQAAWFQTSRMPAPTEANRIWHSERVSLSAAIARTWKAHETRRAADMDGMMLPVYKPLTAIKLEQSGIFQRLEPEVDLAEMDVLSGGLTQFDEALRKRSLFLRAGSLRLDRVTVIDAFGETRPLKLSAPGPVASPLPRRLWTPLTPRLPIWSRLNFRLSAAQDPTDGVDATEAKSPVCGYLLPDLLEDALEVFDVDGRGLGQIANEQIATESNRAVFRWHPWCKEALQPSAGRPASSLIQNRHLRELVEGIEAQTEHASPPPPGRTVSPCIETGLTALMRTLETARYTVGNRVRLNDWRLTFIGQPIAVVRTHMGLEVTSADAGLEHDRIESQPWRQPELLPPVTLKIGDESRANDGVLGVFVSGGQGGARASRFAAVSVQAYEQAYLFDAANPEAGIGLRTEPVTHPFVAETRNKNAVFQLPPAGKSMSLTLLLDLRGDIFLTSGMLPRKSISIPQDFLKASLKGLEPTVRVDSALAVPMADDAVHLTVPAPIEPGYEATWRYEVLDAATQHVTYTDTAMGASPKAGTVPAAAAQLRSGWLQLQQGPEGS